MSFQALLFCQDEKTTRTVTQVLSELDFQVEACSETFAAVKKLTSQAFEAIVVDCQNEENAGLLLKTARNSASNQASLMVAVVEGQAGVAAAFRIGANLVLTKPIAIEQARGTLRVARGLLRKNTAPAATPTPAKQVAAAPAVEAPAASASAPARIAAPPLAPTAAKQPLPSPLSPARPIPSVIPPVTTQPAASAVSAPFGKLETEKEQQPAPDAASAALMEALDYSSKMESPELVPFADVATVVEPQPVKPVGLPVRGSLGNLGSFGAATAPAKEFHKPFETASELTTPFETVVPAAVEPAKIQAVLASAPIEPTATDDEFVLSAAQAPRSNKTPLIAIALLLVVAAVAYFAYSQFKGHAAAPAATAPVTQNFPPTFDDPATSGHQTQPATIETTAAPAAPAAPVETADRFARPAQTIAPDRVSTPAAAKPAQRLPFQVKTQSQRLDTSAVHQEAAPEAPSITGISGASGTQALGAIAMPANKALAAVSLQPQRVSQGVTDGDLIKRVQPVYPTQAVQMHLEGTVVLLATIGKDGSIRNIKTVSGSPTLARAASDAVRQWRYHPSTLNGEPVEVERQISIAFKAPK